MLNKKNLLFGKKSKKTDFIRIEKKNNKKLLFNIYENKSS